MPATVSLAVERGERGHCRVGVGVREGVGCCLYTQFFIYMYVQVELRAATVGVGRQVKCRRQEQGEGGGELAEGPCRNGWYGKICTRIVNIFYREPTILISIDMFTTCASSETFYYKHVSIQIPNHSMFAIISSE